MKIKKREFTLRIPYYADLLAENPDLELEVVDGKGKELFKVVNVGNFVNKREIVNKEPVQDVNNFVNKKEYKPTHFKPMDYS